MDKKQCSYDWASYYQAAYEKEKKKNNILAGKIADAQNKEEELKFNLERIEKSIFWRMSAPLRKTYHMLFSSRGGAGAAALDAAKGLRPDKAPAVSITKGYEKEYRQEVFRQKHPYLQWIEENEKPHMLMETATEKLINGWKKIEPVNTDLCIIVCGSGVLDEYAEEIIKSFFSNNRDCIFAYADEDYYWKDLSNRMHPWYKPCYSPDTMLSFCYPGHMIAVRKSLYHGLLEQERYRTGSYEDFYELCLLLEERAFTLEECDRLAETLQPDAGVRRKRVGNIEHVLFHNCYEPDEEEKQKIEAAERLNADVLEAAENQLQKRLEQGYDMMGADAEYRNVREAALKRRGIKARLMQGAWLDIYHVCYDIEEDAARYLGKVRNKKVSVIIPSKDHPELLEQCLSSFYEGTGYKNYEWIVVDNGSSPENKAKTEALQDKYGFTYIYRPMEFNFSAMCNMGVEKAEGDYILLLNDDIEIIQKDWLELMLGQAMQPHTGAVGAKLWYAGSNVIQHAGITNMGIGPSHKLASLVDNKCYYYGRNMLTYDMVGVTAACLLIEKNKYREVGGMDESMKVAYNDVDFCFKLIEAGYYNVLRNDAVLYHHESMSRGLDADDEGKWNRLLEEKEVLYKKHPQMRGVDIFYNRNLNDDNIKYTCNFKYDYMKKEKLAKLLEEDGERISKAAGAGLHLVVDSAGEQKKGSPDEADIIEITGWSYISGENNAKYSRSILFRREDGAMCSAEPFPWYRQDVEKVLTNEVNTLLSGFVLRIGKNKLKKGRWQVGMLAEDADRRRRFAAWSEKFITI